jgi:hypothetical protein
MTGDLAQVGSALSYDEVYHRVAAIIVEYSGVGQNQITPQARLCEDLGISGDDGDELLQELDRRFRMDWTGIDAGVLFGNEGFGPPPLWMLRRNCMMFEPQSLTIEELASSMHAGHWLKATPLVPIRGWQRAYVYAASALMTLIIVAGLAGMIVALIGWLATRG